MNSVRLTPTTSPPKRSSFTNGVRPFLPSGRPRLILMLILAAAGLAAGWAWFGTAAILPLLYTLPCAAMMAICMKGHGSSSTSTGQPGNAAGTSDTGASQ
jgi:hypothetical protein